MQPSLNLNEQKKEDGPSFGALAAPKQPVMGAFGNYKFGATGNAGK